MSKPVLLSYSLDGSGGGLVSKMALFQDVRKFVLTTLKMFAVSNKLALAETFSNHTFFAVVVFSGL